MTAVAAIDGSLVLHPIVAPVLAGVVTHVACNQYQPASLSAFAFVSLGPPLLVTAIISPPGGLNLIICFLRSFVLYCAATFTSIAFYRLSPFHPLAKYPGPWQAKVTRLWAAKQVTGQWQHHYSHKLFQIYGDVVRTGPDHLIFRDPKAIPVILGGRNPWPKGARYDVSKPDGISSSVLSTIDPGEHSKKRRVWDLAFTSSALKSYEPMLEKRTSQLVAALKARVNQPIDLAEWLAFMALDYMGDFAWGGVFEFMRDGDPDGFRALAERFVNVIETTGAIPWVKPIIVALPRQTGKLLETSFQVAKRRQESGSSNNQKDLFYYLLDEDGSSGHPPMSTNQLAMEATLAITAGSDTTSTAMANAYYYFMKYPTITARLRKELDEAADTGGADTVAYDIDIDEATLASLPYLNAIINETIRLQPAVPNGTQRTPPPDNGPVMVAGHLVPVGTTCQIPTWSLHRDPRHFSPRPEEFWPERWLPEASKLAEVRGEEFVLNTHAYMPFNYGPGNCVGRSLALAEMRKVLSSLIRRFDAHFAPGYNPEDWEKTLRDQYILMRGKLPVVLTERK